MYWFIMLLIVMVSLYKGNIEPGDILIMTVSVGTAALLIGSIVNTIPTMTKHALYLEKLDQFMQREDGEKEINSNDHMVKNSFLIGHIYSIRFENVSFTYPNETEPSIKNISFEIKQNEKLAIVVLNGAGKTTIIKLLMNFYTPDSGKIYINDIDIKLIPKKQYKALFSTIYQDSTGYPYMKKF